MTALPPTEPANSPETPLLAGSTFLVRLRAATYGVVLFVLTIHLLKEFREILQPLFIALFLGFLTHPIHQWLLRHKIPSLVAYGIILALVVLGFFAFGSIMYANVTELAADKAKLQQYEDRLDTILRNVAARLQFEKKVEPDEEKPAPDPKEKKLAANEPIWRGVLSPERLLSPAVAAFGQIQATTTWTALTILYVFFLIAERVSFPRRLALAFGHQRGDHIMNVVGSINEAIGQYIAVKTLVSALAGILSYVVLVFFGVELAASWGILIFLLNYIPYVGSLVACALPIVLSFLKFGYSWEPIVITGLLIGIQQVIGNWVEPRMAGQRLDVSPLLIVLSLAFWWSIWGVFGAILAVPLLVIVRIILDNIPETKPIATLISNR